MWESLSAALSSLTFWQFASIPLISGLVGWATNVMALKMTFYPINFVGFKPIGWQGIIPSKAGVMAGKAVDLLTKNLITIEDRFSQLDAERVADEMEPVLHRLSQEILEETMEEEAPVIWEALSASVREELQERISYEIPAVVSGLMEEVKTHITELFDLREMVVEALEKDRELLNQIFLEVGDQEFRFIERSGFYFGCLFGVVQMVIFYFCWQAGFSAGWILPTAGLFVGWATNYLALRMIFEPLYQRKVLFWRVQGLFIRRQKEVAAAYAQILAREILTAQNIFQRLVEGPTAHRLEKIVQRHIKKAVDQQIGVGKSLIQVTSGAQTYVNIKKRIAKGFSDELPFAIRHVFEYAGEALNIEHTLRTRMQQLGPREFVSFLRPIFQEDEWKLILVGAMLGFGAGLAQWAFIFGMNG
ncbi:MAG: hypothetical protein AAFR61_08240 [Bacteroidota bacterium]